MLNIRSKIKSAGQIPLLTDIDGSSRFNDKSKAVALGKFFASVFSYDSAPNTSSSSIVNPFAAHQFCDVFFHRSEICKILKHLKPSFTEPYDGIPPIAFKNVLSRFRSS